MEENVLQAINELKQAIINDPRIKRLNELDKKMYEDEEVIKAVKKKNDLENRYSSILSYKEANSDEAIAIQKALYQAKLELDSLPLVKEYNEAFVPIKDIYLMMDDLIFAPFRSKTLSHEAR